MQHLPPETWRWDAVDLARAIRLGALSAREATEAALARLAAVNPSINAVVDPLPDLARDAADAADAARAGGAALGALHGVPITVKVNADMAGRATTNGVVAFRDAIAPADSAVVGNLRKAGAIIIGRTNTPAFSWRWFIRQRPAREDAEPLERRAHAGRGRAARPRRRSAGIGAIAHGNDIGGSVRYPAYACGVAGLRPSLGRIPAFNPGAKAERSLSAQVLSTQGPLARRVGDLRLALAAMAAPDWRDPWQAPVPYLLWEQRVAGSNPAAPTTPAHGTRMTTARIYKPAKTAMQSGTARTKQWLLEFDRVEPREIEPLMGWTSSGDTRQQVKLWFDTKDEALAYATREGIAYRIEEPQEAKRRTISYADNFKFNRVGQSTH